MSRHPSALPDPSLWFIADPHRRQDRSMMQLQESVNSISDVLAQFVDQFNGWKSTVESRLPPSRNHEMMSNHASPEASFSAPPREHGTSRWPTPIQGRGHMGRVNSNLKMESPIAPHSNMMSPLGAQASASIKQESQYAPPPQQPATPAESVRTDRSHATETSPKEQTGLQGDHTTPAHKLLDEWQQMSIFYTGIPYLRRLIDNGREVSDYPTELKALEAQRAVTIQKRLHQHPAKKAYGDIHFPRSRLERQHRVAPLENTSRPSRGRRTGLAQTVGPTFDAMSCSTYSGRTWRPCTFSILS
jgi:hypothetical protein